MDKKKFGQFIKEARLAKKLTQAELAEMLYLDVTAISKWERGVNFPDISMIADICKCLDITEHELIESSRDTEQRQMAYRAKRYVQDRRIAFWTVTGAFLTAVLTCFIVNLCVSRALSWFFIVLTSCACGYWAFLFFPLYAMAVKTAGEKAQRRLRKVSFLLYTAGLLLFTVGILLTAHAYAPFDIRFALEVTLYCSLLFFLYGTVRLLPVNLPVRMGMESILTGLYTVSLAKVLPDLMKVKQENYFDIDFTDWAGHTNGNVALIILVSFVVAGLVLILIGTIGKSKKAE